VTRTRNGGSELLKLQENGQFPDESARIKDSQIHNVTTRTRNNRLTGIKEMVLEGRLL
jgi:hypothetical protein